VKRTRIFSTTPRDVKKSGLPFKATLTCRRVKHFACLFKLLSFARPYRGRMVLGIIIGFLAGLTNPILMGSVKLVVDQVFPTPGKPTLSQQIERAAAPCLAPADIKDAAMLIGKLQQGTNAISRFVWGELTVETQQRLTATDLSLANRQVSLVQSLNQILTNGPIYEPNRFLGLSLPKEARHLIAQNPQGPDLVRLNWLLLAAAYPSEIAKPRSAITNSMMRWLARVLNQPNPKFFALGKVLILFSIPMAMLLRGLLNYLNVYLMNWVSIRAITDLRIKLFSHLLTLDAGFFNQSSTGELMSRFTEVNFLQGLISGSMVTLIREPITIISLLAYLLFQQPMLTCITLSVLPLTILPFLFYSQKVRRASYGMYMQVSDMGKLLHETFTGYRVVKAYNLENRMVDEFRKTSGFTVSFFMRMLRSTELPGPLIEFLGALGVTAFFIYLTYHGDKTPGDLLMFVGSVFLMYAPIKNLVRLNTQIEQANAASQFIFHLLDARSNVAEPVQPKPLLAVAAPIQFDNVSFTYGEKKALENIQLTLAPGKVVALVGSSGSGKTTLANLLLRFFDPQQGAVRINGMDIREATTSDLRRQIAVVTQEVMLFNDTIRNNILIGRPGATDEEIVTAARAANAHEFIMEKPGGYNAFIGERGVALSGGQRQRLAIARAILKNAPILILDEATSALDTESERVVQAALDRLMQDRTTLVIAHRLSTIQNADLIVALEQGHIMETGTHTELVHSGGVYQKLYELQFKMQTAP